jgi:hypothetical protein
MKNDMLNDPGNPFNQEPNKVMIEKPLLNDEIKHVNGKYAEDDDDDDIDTEDDLVLGDEELEGDEMEFEVELEDDMDADDVTEDDLILGSSDDPDEEDESDDDL